jgi:hypothetical protein
MVRILFCRHGEKNTSSLDTIDYYLNEKGRKRSLDLTTSIVERFGIPDIIIARAPKFPQWSFRSIETIYPLGQRYNRPILTSTLEDVGSLIKRYINTDYLIVVCWEHTEIPIILNSLGQSVVSWSKDPFKYPTDDNDYSTIIEYNGKDIVVH